MLWLAHDGSLNSEWLSHYAVRLAREMPDRAVTAVFVQDESQSPDELELKLARLEKRCLAAHLSFASEVLPLCQDVTQTLLQRIQPSPRDLLLCGTRVKRRKLGFLRGTVSEQLLRQASFPVLALRIVAPGLLGTARRLLLPVMGRPEGIAPAVPLLRLLAPPLDHVFLLSVRDPQGADRWDRPTSGTSSDLDEPRRTHLARMQKELTRELGHRTTFDHAVLASNDPAGEIVLAAKQHRCQLILLGATQRPFAERLVLGTPAERILRFAPCDIAIYGGRP